MRSVSAGQNFREGAKIGYAHNARQVNLTDFRPSVSSDSVDGPVAGFTIGTHHQHPPGIIDIDLGAGFRHDGANDFTTRSDDVANLSGLI